MDPSDAGRSAQQSVRAVRACVCFSVSDSAAARLFNGQLREAGRDREQKNGDLQRATMAAAD